MRQLADETKFEALVNQLAEAVRQAVASSDAPEAWAVVGVRSRGDILAQRIAKLVDGSLAKRVGSLDITLYRDDLSEIGSQAVVQITDVPFNIDGLHVLLVDDVLMTGRSIRAALQSLMDLGRPRRVWLAALVDRGGRELPISPDFVALDLTANGQAPVARDRVDVKIRPTDDCDAILIRSDAEQEAD